MTLAIVILNWNGLELLKTYLPSIVSNSSNYTIYVADNASTDGSVAWLKKHYKEVRVIQNSINLGFAGGYNKALQGLKEDVLCLLNSDVAVTPGWCDPIINAFKSDESLGAAMPKILDINHKGQFEYAGASGGYLDQLGYPYCRGRIFNTLELDRGQYDNAVTVDWASGAALFIKRTIFEQCKGFDVDYFAHQEEIDLCWRLRRLGFTIQVIPLSVVYHLGGGTLSNLSPKKTFLNFRNSLLTIVKNDNRSFYGAILLIRMVLDGLAAIQFLFQGRFSHFTAIFKAHISFYNYLGRFLEKRKAFKTIEYQKVKNQGVSSIVWKYFVKQKKLYSNL